MTFQNEHSYNLNDPDLQHFITNTQFDREINNLDTIYSSLNDMNITYIIEIKNQRDVILLKRCTLAINNPRSFPLGVNTIDNN